VFFNKGFYKEGLLAPHQNPQAEGPPLICCPQLLIQFIRGYPPYRRPFLYPQPEDAPCRADRDPVHGIIIIIIIIIIICQILYAAACGTGDMTPSQHI